MFIKTALQQKICSLATKNNCEVSKVQKVMQKGIILCSQKKEHLQGSIGLVEHAITSKWSIIKQLILKSNYLTHSRIAYEQNNIRRYKGTVI